MLFKKLQKVNFLFQLWFDNCSFHLLIFEPVLDPNSSFYNTEARLQCFRRCVCKHCLYIQREKHSRGTSVIRKPYGQGKVSV